MNGIGYMSNLISFSQSMRPLTVALRITLLYAMIGSLWILFSDQLLILLFNPETIADYAQLQTFKGWFFIAMTAVILFALIKTSLRKLRHSELLRHHSEERYRTIFETTRNPTALIEADLTISLVNHEFELLSGYGKKEIEGKLKWTDCIADKDLERLRAVFEDLQSDAAAVSGLEFSFKRQDGSVRLAHLELSHIPEANQSVASLLDITEKKSLEVKYLRAQRLESIGTLAGGIAHDLNNILSPILLSIHSIKPSLTDPKQQRMISIVETSTKRGADLVKQILTFARGHSGGYISIQPQHLIKEIESIACATFPRLILINVDVPKDLHPITGDPTQIHQALLNLSVNARDAMPDGGTLQITARNISIDEAGAAAEYPEASVGDYVMIGVTDSGSGMSPEIIRKIFTPFFTTKEEGKGTGLGLATVEYIVKNHKGFLRVDSEVGKGTAFRLFFPAQSPEIGQPTVEDLSGSAPAGNNELLLLVDDDAAVSEITAEILKTHGYRVVSARDGAEGVSTYLKHLQEIVLVLTDSNMPFMDGAAMIRRLKEVNPKVKILITSGSREEVIALRQVDANIVGHLQKPYSTGRLLEKVNEILSERNTNH